jgi:hypothetical protein
MQLLQKCPSQIFQLFTRGRLKLIFFQAYYGPILESLKRIQEDSNHRRLINTLVDREVASLTKMHDVASTVVNDLKEFRDAAEKDKEALESQRLALEKTLPEADRGLVFHKMMLTHY